MISHFVVSPPFPSISWRYKTSARKNRLHISLILKGRWWRRHRFTGSSATKKCLGQPIIQLLPEKKIKNRSYFMMQQQGAGEVTNFFSPWTINDIKSFLMAIKKKKIYKLSSFHQYLQTAPRPRMLKRIKSS